MEKGVWKVLWRDDYEMFYEKMSIKCFMEEMSSETELRTGASDGGEHTNLTYFKACWLLWMYVWNVWAYGMCGKWAVVVRITNAR